MSEPILFCYGLEKDKPAFPLEGQAALERIKSPQLAWAHLDADHPETADWLKTHIDYLDPLIIEALIAENTRPRAEEIGKGFLVILRGVNMNENADPEDMVSLRIWVDENRIISLRKRALNAVSYIVQKSTETALIQNSGDFLAQLSMRLFQNMEPFVSALSEQLDDIEEELSENVNAQRRFELTDIRKKAIMYRRYFAPQKDVMIYLRTSDALWLDHRHRRQLQENQDRITRYLEDLDAVRERAQIIKDELSNALSEKLNKNLYILSIVTTIFLPLSFLTGLLGINVGGMPGANYDAAFWIVCALCVVLGFGQYALLRLLKWL